MTSDLDTRRAAERLIDRFGAAAITRAEERIAALQKQRDHAGVATWRRIAAAILDLQGTAAKDPEA